MCLFGEIITVWAGSWCYSSRYIFLELEILIDWTKSPWVERSTNSQTDQYDWQERGITEKSTESWDCTPPPFHLYDSVITSFTDWCDQKGLSPVLHTQQRLCGRKNILSRISFCWALQEYHDLYRSTADVCEINRLMFGFELAPVYTNLLNIRSIVYLIHVQKMKQKGGNCSSHLLFLLTVTHLFPHGKLCRLSLLSRLYRLLYGSDW